ncbi:hypothetical protein Tco_0882227 [Tanacetum coccineum]
MERVPRLQEVQIHVTPLALLQSNMLELMRLYSSLVQLMRERHRSNKIKLVHGVGVLWKQEGEPADAAGFRATTSAIRAMTSGAG